VPLGTIIAIYLSEFAPPRVREIVKPFLELIRRADRRVRLLRAAVRHAAAAAVHPGACPASTCSAPGIVIGIMIIPISSLSEDAMRAVPMELREAPTRWARSRLQTALRW
jgi:phosphate transport system permease protein